MKILALGFTPDTALGAVASDNVRAMRQLGHDVRLELFDHSVPETDAPVVYHHWHPQPRHAAKPCTTLDPAKYHIAFWVYEAEILPTEFKIQTGMREIWTPSEYSARLFAGYGVPVHVVPHYAEVPHMAESAVDRCGPRRVLTCFDAWSRVARKQPQEAIRCFQEAFPGRTDVELVVKCHHMDDESMAQLRRWIGADGRVRILADFLSDAQVGELYRTCDVYLGMQRSEGFGLNLAKAEMAGMRVVTNGYGGHTDFLAEAMLVPYRMRPVSGDEYYKVGRWAEADFPSAVQALRNSIDLPRVSGEKVREHCSWANLVNNIRTRLTEIEKIC